MNSTRSKRYWGTQRVARACQVSPATVASWIDQGHLKGHKTPTGRRRVAADDLIRFLHDHGMAVPPELAGTNGADIVVVVEDDVGYLRALVATLERSDLGLEIVEATTGVDALLEIGRVQPALIVLDYTLPDMNAVQILERLLEPGRLLKAEVVVVTGGLGEDAEAQLKGVGVKTVVNKAEGMDAVIGAIREGLRRRKAA